jgi:2',3'-cyclic-nucleotide 2'-phosphodiesterase / 3'-nucleotidase / 5'-nucleotidase
VRRLSLLGAALLSWSCANPPTPTTPVRPGDSLHVRVLATHDLHGALLSQIYPWSNGRQVGGAAALKAWGDSLAARCKCRTLRLDGGDQMQGTLESNLVHGASVVRAFNLMRLDAAAVGNHELDWGVDTLIARQREAQYPWLAANVFLKGTNSRPEWAKPYAIVEKAGARIGVIGYATVNTPNTLRTATVAPYDFRAGVGAIREVLDVVRQQRPDFIVIVAHAGGECGTGTCSGEMVTLASQLDSAGVDLIIGGHTHNAGVGVVNGIPIVRASSHARAISVVDLFRLRDGRHRFELSRDTLYVDAVTPDAAMLALLRPYVALADSIARVPVATMRDSVNAGNRALGHLIADAARRFASADFGLHNTGGVRAPLAAGAVNYNDLFRVLPFGNAMVRITLTGRQLREAVEYSLGRSPQFFSGLRVSYDPAAPVGGRIVSLSLSDGSPIIDDRSYTLGTADYLADGGDGYTMFLPLPKERYEPTLLDALIAHLRALPQPVVAPTDERVIRVTR